MRSCSRSRRLGPILLTLSLGLNLFLIGWFASQGLFSPHVDRHGLPPQQAAEVIAAPLPAADAAIVRHVIASRLDEMNAAHANSQSAFAHLRAVMVADPIDPAALRDAFGQIRTARQTERGLFGQALIDILPQMSLEGRQIFVKTQMGGHP